MVNQSGSHTGRILVLGGYGVVGSAVARYLLEYTNCDIVVAGRDVAKAVRLGSALRGRYGSHRVETCYANAASPECLSEVMAKARLVVVSIPYGVQIGIVMRAALASQVDYIDMFLQRSVLKYYREVQGDVKEKKRCFVVHAGVNPGIIVPTIRKLCAELPGCASVHTSLLATGAPASPSRLYDSYDMRRELWPLVYKDGGWRLAKKEDIKIVTFPRHRRKRCYPLFVESLRGWPKALRLNSFSHSIAMQNRLMNYVIQPCVRWSDSIWFGFGRGLWTRLMWLSLHLYRGPRELMLVADGCNSERRLRIIVGYRDAYELTAMSVVACLRQYLRGAFGPGLHFADSAVDPDQFFADLQEMGLKLTRTTS